ncbi:MAG: integrase arm-type DNA-binding domain-containing protein [Chromatiales bacterium]|nr:integrase arm-type DNA-binding domain-containing protein [Chromatiales bacterium]
MPNITLSDARVKALRPRPSAYDIRDAKLRGFGLRVLPSGSKRFFIHTQHRRQRVWKTVGAADAITVDEARAQAASLLTAIRCGTEAPASPDAMRFESVAETVFRRYAQVWKPRTLYVNRHYLRRHILPRFAGTQVSDITRADVQRWFTSLRATPVSADRSMPVLSVIMTEAERMGYRPEGSNPCRDIRRHRRKGRERFLSDAEIGRLAARLSAHEDEWPLQVAAVRLLLLTGCRMGEVLTLRWSDCREGRLFLRDSKSGPRTVWLSNAACNLLDCIHRSSA